MRTDNRRVQAGVATVVVACAPGAGATVVATSWRWRRSQRQLRAWGTEALPSGPSVTVASGSVDAPTTSPSCTGVPGGPTIVALT